MTPDEAGAKLKKWQEREALKEATARREQRNQKRKAFLWSKPFLAGVIALLLVSAVALVITWPKIDAYFKKQQLANIFSECAFEKGLSSWSTPFYSEAIFLKRSGSFTEGCVYQALKEEGYWPADKQLISLVDWETQQLIEQKLYIENLVITIFSAEDWIVSTVWEKSLTKTKDFYGLAPSKKTTSVKLEIHYEIKD